MKVLKFIFLLSIIMIEFSCAQDGTNLNHYKTENTKIGLPDPGENRIVFIGNSITENWKKLDPEFFSNKSYINRGISGETTPQILNRFKADVIDLKPSVVVILAGINDIAENTGPITIKEISENIISMVVQANSNGIKIVLSSVLPAIDFPWRPELQPSKKIVTLNEIIKNYADENGIIYLDYYSNMVDKHLGLKDKYTYDGVHPNKKGYQKMAPLAEEAIKKVLN